MKKINKKHEFENLIGQACETYEGKGKCKKFSAKKTKVDKIKKSRI